MRAYAQMVVARARQSGWATPARSRHEPPAWCNGGVPWCVSCNKFLTPSTVQHDGTCPKCGNTVERGLIPGMTRSADEEPPAVPWHLKLFGVGLAIYLGYRALELVDWLLHR